MSQGANEKQLVRAIRQALGSCFPLLPPIESLEQVTCKWPEVWENMSGQVVIGLSPKGGTQVYK